MTKILGFGRVIGKTTMSIFESYATGYRILASSRREARHIAVTAKQMGYAIPEPWSVYDFEIRLSLFQALTYNSQRIDTLKKLLN